MQQIVGKISNSPRCKWLSAVCALLCIVNHCFAGEPVPLPDIRVNEVLTRGAFPLEDSVELFNASAGDIDLGNWSLTDNPIEPQKCKIPAGTILHSGRCRTFYKDNGLNFTLSQKGGEIYVYSLSVTGAVIAKHGFGYGQAEDGVSFGRHVISTGEEHFVAQQSRTLNGPNSGPRISPAVISEIMYNPPLGGYQYVEIYNRTNSVVPLYDALNPGNAASIGGIGFVFPAGVNLPPHGFILICGGVDTATFREHYSIPSSVQVFGPFPGTLSKNGDTITIKKPDTPVIDGTTGQPVAPLITIDAVTYAPLPPWPGLADGLGSSLERISLDAYGNDPANWRGSFLNGTPGAPPVLSTDSDGIVDSLDEDDDGDGIDDVDELAAGTDPKNKDSKSGGSADFDLDNKTDDVDLDDDNDGVSDANEIADGTNPYNAAVYVRSLMLIKGLTASANFKLTGKDKISVAGVLGNVPPVNPDGQTVSAEFGGSRAAFFLDSKGRGSSTNVTGKLSLIMKGARGRAFSGGDVPFSVAVSKGALKNAWLDLGFDPEITRSIPMDMLIRIELNGRVYEAVFSGAYAGKKNAAGVLKKAIEKKSKN